MNKVINDSVISSIFQLLKIIVRLFTGIYIVKTLDIDVYGVYNLFLLFISLGSTLFSFNVHEYFNIAISQSKNITNKHRFFWTTLETLALSSVFFTILLNSEILSNFLLNLLNLQNYYIEYKTALIMLILTAISMTIVRYLAYSKYIMFFQIWTFFLQSIWIVPFIIIQVTLINIFYSQIVMSISLIFIGLLYIYIKEKENNFFKIENLIPDLTYLRKSILYGIFTYIALLGAFFLEITDKVMLSIIRTNNDVAYYSFANIPFNILNAFIVGTVFLISMPYINEYDTNQKIKKYNLYRKLINNLIIYLSGIVLIISLFSKEIILLLGKPDYLETSNVFPLISCILLLTLVNSVLKHELMLQNSLKKLMFIYTSGIILNVILNFYTIPAYAFFGAFLSTLLTQVYLVISLFIASGMKDYYRINVIKIISLLFSLFLLIIFYNFVSLFSHAFINHKILYLLGVSFFLYLSYIALLYFFKLIPKNHFTIIYKYIMNKIT